MAYIEQFDAGDYVILRHACMAGTNIPRNIYAVAQTLAMVKDVYNYEAAVFPGELISNGVRVQAPMPVQYSKQALWQEFLWYPYMLIRKDSPACRLLSFPKPDWQTELLHAMQGKVFSENISKYRWDAKKVYPFVEMQEKYLQTYRQPAVSTHGTIKKLGAIFVASKNIEYVTRTITALRAQYESSRFDAGLYIYWNGHPACTQAILSQCAELDITNAQVVQPPPTETFSYSVAMNALWERYVRTRVYDNRHILLINDDFLLDKRAIVEAIAFMEDNKKCGVLGGKWREWGSNKICHAGVYAKFLARDIDNMRATHLRDRRTVTHRPPWVTFACALIRDDCARDVFLYYANMFDEAYHGDCTDMDYCQRVKACGYEVWMDAHFTGQHMVSASRKHDDIVDAGNARFFSKYQIEDFIPGRLPCELSL